MILLLLFGLCSVQAYREESFNVDFVPKEIRISDACTLYATQGNGTFIRFHESFQTYNTSIYSERVAVNQDCTLVVFGFPDLIRNNSNTTHHATHADGTGIVKLWEPFSSIETIIAPLMNEISWLNPDWDYKSTNTSVYRFGFSVDVQNNTWVVGAPGNVGEYNQPTSIGYAFVYEGSELHSCRSLYETGCVPYGDDCKTGYSDWKRYYGYLKSGSDTNLHDKDVNEFQKKCIPPQLPYYKGGYYGGGPLKPVLVPYFEWQQFGYDVTLTGPVDQLTSSLFISAPGDTNRFMENAVHKDGKNYGRVYAWETSANSPKNDPSIVPGQNITINWWKPAALSPYGPPEIPGSVYRGFGRSIAASKTTLAIATYPIYAKTYVPFVYIYDCNSANCVASTYGGISVNDIPKNALYYLTTDDLSYSDTADIVLGDYIVAPHYQNEFIGSDIGVAGSNVIVPNHKYVEYRGLPQSPRAFRFGTNTRLREAHHFEGHARFGSNTQHWVLSSHKRLTHLWPCDIGHTGYKPVDGTTENCQPCDVQRVSDDGWHKTCGLCPVNLTTYLPGQSQCKTVVPRVYLGFQEKDGFYTIGIIVVVGLLAWCLFIVCEFKCLRGRNGRKNRIFTEIV